MVRGVGLCFFFAAHAYTQTEAGNGPSLDVLLDRLQANIADFRRSVPDLVCTERARVEARGNSTAAGPSLEAEGGQMPAMRAPIAEVRQQRDSIFRLRRLAEPGDMGIFEESRVVESVDGRRTVSDTAGAASPVQIYGVFSNTLNILSREGQACFAFRLREIKAKQIVVNFSELPEGERNTVCPPFEGASGRVLVDRLSMHIVRVEKKTPRREITPGVFGSWEWTEEYAPLYMLGRTFWMPKSIHSKSASESGTQVGPSTLNILTITCFTRTCGSCPECPAKYLLATRLRARSYCCCNVLCSPKRWSKRR